MIKFPVCVVIYLTDYCKLKCKHCFLTQTSQLNKNMIEFNKLKKLLLTFKENNVFMIAFTGGDPMLHPEIFEILNYTRNLGMLPLLGISGTDISYDIAKKIYESGVRCVQVGLNGSNAKLNDYYRGKGNFEEVMSSVNNLKKANINVNLAFCLDRHNLFDLKNMLELANSLNIYKVKIEFWNCLNNSNNENELSDDEKNDVREICCEFMNLNNKENWIQYPKATTNLVKIHSNALIIMSNGDVKKHEMGETLGNIYLKDIKDILEE